MSSNVPTTVDDALSAIYRDESRRIFATLVKLLGDFDLAEEALQDAFTAAVDQWPQTGVPSNPRAWLISTGRHKAIDSVRRRQRLDTALPELARRQTEVEATISSDSEYVEDDRLRLIFTCCHPALDASVQVPLTLREVCGLSTDEVASAFLVSSATMAQRLVRGKAKIRSAGIPYVVPSANELPERLESVLSVIYLVFNEGYSASSGQQVTREFLSAEAIRLGRLLARLLPDPETLGLLALMLLHESRRPARTDSAGDIVLLEDQDRTLWNQDYIDEGKQLIERSLQSRRFGVYTIQAAISAVHAETNQARHTDWAQIVGLYDALMNLVPSPVVALNRAVAIGMRDGPAVGLELIDPLLEDGPLEGYHLAHAARADFCRRLGRASEAKVSYEKALRLAKQEPEQRLLRKRLAEFE